MTVATSEYTTVYDLTVDPVLEAYLPGPPVTTDEQLKESLLAAGRAYDPVKVWGKKIVDGHRRYKFCKLLGLPYRTEPMDFKDMGHAKFFMDQWYHAQRHMDSRESKLSLARMVDYEKKSRAAEKAAGKKPTGGTPTQKVAKAAGVSTRTVERAEQFAKDHERQAYAAIAPELRGLIESRELRLAIEDVVQLASLPVEKQMEVYSEFSQTHHRTIACVLRGLEEDTPVATDLTPEEIADLAKAPRSKKKKDSDETAVVDVVDEDEVSEEWEEGPDAEEPAQPENTDTVSVNEEATAKKPPSKPALDLINDAYRNIGLAMKSMDDLQDLIPNGFRYSVASNAKNEWSNVLKEWQADANAGKGGA